jgi:ATP-dependent protease Clp ATPase subunit
MSTEQQIQSFRDTYAALQDEIGKVIVGHTAIVENTLIALFGGGHVLLEGVPGLGKTLLIRTLGEVLDMPFNRIQFSLGEFATADNGLIGDDKNWHVGLSQQSQAFQHARQEFKFVPGFDVIGAIFVYDPVTI